VIGGRLVRALKLHGFAVRCLVHQRAVDEADEQVRGNLDDVVTLESAVSGADSVVHLAAETHARDQRQYERVNALGTENLVRAAERGEVRRFVHASSRAISPEGGAYSVAKLRAEVVLRNSSLEHTILRLAEVYGGGGREGVDRIVDAARRGAPMLIVGDGTDRICPVHLDDVVGVFRAAVDAPAAAGKTYTIGGSCVTILDFAEACRVVFRSDSRLIRVPTAIAHLAMLGSRWLPLPLYPDQLLRLRSPKDEPTPEALADLCFKPMPLPEGLLHAVQTR
jgi:nucleoside-diphosphate-sugar epimerase